MKGGLVEWMGLIALLLVLTPSGSHCSGRYASYWNAYLFHQFLSKNCQQIASTHDVSYVFVYV